MEKIIGIYKITNPKGRVYIGQSVNIEQRWSHHRALYATKSPSKLFNSLKKYTPEAHLFELLEICSKDLLNERERYYIVKFDSFDSEKGLNLTMGGDSKVVLSEETKLKIGAASKGNTHWLGKHHSAEAKQKIGMAMKGNTYRLGETLSESTRKKMSEFQTGRTRSAETRKKMSRAKTGTKCSAETRKKICRSRIGKKQEASTSKYFGVFFKKSHKRWIAVIQIDKKRKYIGSSKNESEAAILYDAYILKNIPYDIPLNFPTEINNNEL